MSTKDLQEKYGSGGSKAAINRAIRAEIPGGNELLDALETVHKLAGHRDNPEYASISRALTLLRAAATAMEAAIRLRYQMPPK